MNDKPSKETIEMIKKLRGAGGPAVAAVSTGSAEEIKTNATATVIDAAASQSVDVAENQPKKQIRTLIMNGKILNNDDLDKFIDSLVQ
ncbi:MAG: hypothetical protein LBL47_01660 [Lactobacillus sp.]|jgi:hypothetical protein|nr:hypothetical protein [Lactobacillus sp.]